MKESAELELVKTIRERCRVCYTCVRECPAKAIRVVSGQAEVIAERCIGCGNCVKVCSQRAKEFYNSIPAVRELLAASDPVAALLAPSFPAEFSEWDYPLLVGALRALGFAQVVEVAAGAVLVAERYRRLMSADQNRSYIATTCPAIIAYVERYFPSLVSALAPIVSPMIAVARALRVQHGQRLKLVFVGPCIAKKGEAASLAVTGEIDEVLTFTELREMIGAAGLSRANVVPGEFDPPMGGAGALFPISRGLLQAASIPEDLTAGNVVVAEGRAGFVEAIKEFQAGYCRPHLLEVLACEGCIMGPGISNAEPLYRRRTRVSEYVRARLQGLDEAAWERQMAELAELDLGRKFSADDRRFPEPSRQELENILQRMGKRAPEDELNCGACGYDTCVEHAVAIYRNLAQSEMCLPYTIERLRETISNLAVSNEKLEHTQEVLMQAEKLASMGQLAAGIAHELNNPLGVVLMYAHLLLEEYGAGEAMREDLTMIASQADRCKRIIAGLLHFARQNQVNLEAADICDLAENCLRLVTFPENVQVRIVHEMEDPMAEVDRDQLTQVMINLIGNALQAMPQGGELTLRTAGDEDEIRLMVSDTGAGIPRDLLAKIFEPFFTTKDMGKGTGMGLAVSYGIVKMHRGNIQVTSNADPAAGPTGSTFSVTLPRHGSGAPEAEPDSLLMPA